MKILATILVVLALSNKILGETAYDGYQVWRVIPDSLEAVETLNKLGDAYRLDFWQEPTAIGKAVDILISPIRANEIRKKLELKGLLDIKVSISDVQALMEKEKRSTKTRTGATARSLATFDYSTYHPAEEVYEWMALVVEEHSDIATKEQIGITYQGRPIYILKFEKSRPSAATKPVIFVDALIHCREWITTASLMFIFKEMLSNPSYTHMIDDVDWYFVPMINIDGYVETWTGDRLWRKTKSTGPSPLCDGVDGNRNWDAFWSMPGASSNPCSYTYYGPTPASESEIRHLANYVMEFKKTRHIDSYVSTHSYSQLILYPYNSVETPSADDDLLNMTGKMMNEAIFKVHGKYYTYGPGATTIYVSSGTTTDWTYEVAKVDLSFTYELRDTGEYGFLLPAEQIIPNGEEYLAGLESLSSYVTDNFEGSGM